MNSLPNNLSSSSGGLVGFLNQPRVYNNTSIHNTPTSEKTREQEAAEVEAQIATIQREIEQIEKEIEYIETYGERSPYQGLVLLNKSRFGAQQTDPQAEIIEFVAHRSLSAPITVSDWSLRSKMTNRTVKIGKAVKLFFSGTENSKESIILNANDRVSVVTGRSPIGESFQVNKCSGYFAQFQAFYPGLPIICPAPYEEIKNYTRDTGIFNDDVCMDFVDGMRRCTVVTTQLPIELSYTCQDAIFTEINYNSCITNHKNEKDFYLGDWRVYLKQSSELWKSKREVIMLLDENEKVVDYFTY